MTLSEIKQTLAAHDLRLTKSLGQNFLHDANQLQRIVALAELSPADKVLEVGPGLGPLTERLMACAGNVLAIEKDARLVRLLDGRFRQDLDAGHLQMVHADALDWVRNEDRDWNEWKLVANLPYSTGSAILVELTTAPRPPRLIVATLQLEVARRLMAQPSSPDYGVLTLLVQLDFRPDDWFRIPATCFFPEPDVQSACVRLSRRTQPLLGPDLKPEFARIVKRAFSQRRKMMLKLLKSDWPAATLDQAFAQNSIPANARAETITPAQFAGLTSALAARE
jgi:16S rRNA (adenine1518-N6/adenine1519-N6)-dimethyltransferase